MKNEIMDTPTKTLNSSLKTLKIFYSVFKWYFIAINVVLLLIGLFAGLPWRVSLIFMIVPAAGFFMPRNLQKWVWILLSLVTIGLYIWIRSPEVNSSRLTPYTYSAESLGIVLSADKDPNNAAKDYLALFNRHHEDLFEYPVNMDVEYWTYVLPWNENDQPQLAAWMKPLEPELGELMRIAAKQVCHFDPPLNMKELDQQYKRLNTTKAFVRVLLRSANQDLYHHRTQTAMQKQYAALRIANHLWQQGTLADQSGGYFIERMARRALSRSVIEYATDRESLYWIEMEILAVDSHWPQVWTEIHKAQKALTISLSGLFYQHNPQGHFRFSRNIPAGLHEHLGYRVRKFLLSAETSRMVALGLAMTIPSSPRGTADLIESRFDRLSDMAEAGQDFEVEDGQYTWRDGVNATSFIDWYARQQVAFYYPLADQDLSFEQGRTALGILITLKRYQLDHGQWPENLTAAFGAKPVPTDPLNSQAFGYSLRNGQIRLYSFGSNAIDDQGQKDKRSKDDIMLWPSIITNNNDLQAGHPSKVFN
ncbi:MAG: hypothetical protein ABFD91_17245 [Anaerohalosphaeraceae bacterium]